MLTKIFKYSTVLVTLLASWLMHTPAFAQSRFVQIDHGGNIICALRDDNAAFCTSDFNISARTPADLAPAQKVSAGSNTSCILLETGDIECFGSGAFDLTNPPTAGAPYKDVSINNSHACAINSINGLECWGIESNGRLDAPEGEFVQVSLSSQSACAVDINGSVSCWGANDLGTADVPADLPPAIKVVSGFSASCALLTDGSVQCWGRSIPPMTGPFVDMDMYAFGNFESGSSGVCATDDEGVVECQHFSYEEDLIFERNDIEGPQGNGISSVSLNFFGGGCFINNTGNSECFGFGAANTTPPRLDGSGNPVPATPETTGLRALVYSGTNIELFWDAPRDAFNVAGHEIRRNGEIVEFTQNLSSFLFTDLTATVTEEFAVRRVDVSGGRGEFSETIFVTSQIGEPNLPPNPNFYVPPERVFEDSFVDAFVFCFDEGAEIFWFSFANTDAIDGYELHRDGEFIAFVEGDFFFDEGIRPGVRHIYDVIAIDLEEPTRFLGVASTSLEIFEEVDADFCEG